MIRSISGITGIVLVLLSACRQQEQKSYLLEPVTAETSGIDFTNNLRDTPDFNIVEYLYFYNGAGVAAGDINNDGLDDLYFVSNQEPNRLYLNKGGFRFEDITATSGTAGEGNWKTGVNMADLNQDGFTDIIVCGVGGYKKFNGQLQVFLNNGNLTFREAAAELGLNFQGFSTQTILLDGDMDGDLDLYLLNHSVHTVRSMGNIDLRAQDDRTAGDKYFENRLVPDGTVRFREATSTSGILSSALGYGLGAGADDLNGDGITDLYISNDFHENDYLYTGDGKGHFNQVADKALRHTSRFSMGNEIADLNNDGRPDIVTLDMLPWEERVIKSSASEDPYDIFQYKLRLGFINQFARNTLQLNTGNDSEGNPRFTDIAPFAGIEATDWSWSPLAADFDNDGWQDLFITNGILRRPNDMDYISFISDDSAKRSLEFGEYVKRMPSGTVPDKMFRNNGDLTFSDQNGKWIPGERDLSNGAAYSDLDNDGDLDLVVNTINEPAKIYRNNSDSTRFLQVDLTGPTYNRDATGSTVLVYYGGKVQRRHVQRVRGFQSAVTGRVHVGLGKVVPDSVVIQWPDGTVDTRKNPEVNSLIRIEYRKGLPKAGKEKTVTTPFFTRLADGPVHLEDEFSAFSRERLLPHSWDAVGPALANGDFNSDGVEDLFVSGGAGTPAKIMYGTRQGGFNVQDLAMPGLSTPDAAAAIIVDANGDKKDDLLVVPGGQDMAAKPVLFLQRSGRLSPCESCLPELLLNGSCAVATDMDQDGDQDLFIGASLVPDRYGEIPVSYLLLNDGTGRFSEAGKQFFPGGNNRLGMIHAAQQADLNNDRYPDLILAGEWMGIKILMNIGGTSFRDESEQRGLSATEGWWHSLVTGDFDSDGDTDLMAGNHGTNMRLRASIKEPVMLLVGDMDRNGSTDQLLTYYNGGSQTPFVSRDQLVKQLPALRKHYLRYSAYADATPADILKNLGEPKVNTLKAVTFRPVYLENREGRFTKTELPSAASWFPVFAICPVDLNGDRYTDFILGGNHQQEMTEIGRLDAGQGLVLTGKGEGRFEVTEDLTAGIRMDGDCKSIVQLKMAGGEKRIAVGVNGMALQWYRIKPVRP